MNITEKEKLRREKISKTLTGFKRPPFSESHREKLRLANLGKKLPQHVMDKMTFFKKGNKFALGYKHTEEWKKKRRGCVPHNKGKPMLMNRGENNVNWKGGVTTENRKIRSSLEYKIWRRAVYERDDYTCQFCWKRGGDIEADHIKRFADYPHLRLELSNGRTLCKPCHRKTYKIAKAI